MPALYKVGEAVGPGTVLEDTFTVNDDGTSVEHVVFSWGQQSTMYAREEPADHHEVRARNRSEWILVPYTVRHPATVAAVPAEAVWVDVSGHRFDYWRLLVDWWWVGVDLAIVEHDVAPHAEVWDEFAACPEPWCYFRYSNFTDENAAAWHWGILGCTRFRAALIDAVPFAARDVEERWRDWHYLSTGLGVILREAGFTPHMHGVIDHHRMMDVGGVVAAMEAA